MAQPEGALPRSSAEMASPASPAGMATFTQAPPLRVNTWSPLPREDEARLWMALLAHSKDPCATAWATPPRTSTKRTVEGNAAPSGREGGVQRRAPAVLVAGLGGRGAGRLGRLQGGSRAVRSLAHEPRPPDDRTRERPGETLL